ncbi:NADPH:quinone reductase-like Zn-dependent oxidoreductase [Kibdelosporangium banguiense]|uniref:NADPH:quinone reductase-like Zn-dependent oxidoreductase n=1 Tax=Kibdelosporangium banguiense TaxID=1365924 RepID=A0ABS4TIX5_9PSEU|nr:NAD(P)-dependent alcohol dehydrogenase [Kibdelosporangium banguiense]MBP2324364.1 NADPH:quinone reductase-like Zn-dependent oxidoreductase [Kibdelosporangium banguiense]
MKAIVQDRYGSTSTLKFSEVDSPTPRSNEVLVRVHAAALNAYDWHAMRGDPYMARLVFGLGGPKRKIRGRDFAGQVEAVGSAVTSLRPGDEVYGDLGDANGAFAEYVCVPADSVDLKPANLTFEQAAAVPLAAITALTGLRDVNVGERVLINGASGGVGTFAVQIAKAFGAHVTAVCSKRNADLVSSLGADRVVDYTQEDFARTEDCYDIVFDLVGNRSLTDLRSVLTPKGTLLLCGGGIYEGGSLFGPMRLVIKARFVSPFVRHRLRLVMAEASTENRTALRELLELGKVKPVVDRTYQLAETAEALRYLEEDHARAKVVITVA